MLLMLFSIALLLSSGLLLISANIFAWPSRRARRNIHQTTKPKLTESLFAEASRLLLKFVRMQPYERRKLEADLERAGIQTTPEEYKARAIASCLLTSSLSIPAFLIGVPIAGLGLIGLGILRYFKSSQQVGEMLKQKDEQIADALPRFALTVNNMLQNSRDLKKIFEKYLADVSDTPLATDLKKLLARIEANMNMAEALQMFGSALGIPYIQSFVSGLIEVTKGVDQSSFFERVSADMRALGKENKKRKLAVRRKQVKRVTMLMLGCFIMVYMTPIIMQLLQGFSLFN